jgi:hypothetical protein
LVEHHQRGADQRTGADHLHEELQKVLHHDPLVEVVHHGLVETVAFDLAFQACPS